MHHLALQICNGGDGGEALNAFSTWTEADVAAHNARLRREVFVDAERIVAVREEASLHNEILEACHKRGWIALHGSMAHKTFRTPGEFDFIILANCGRVFLVECKTRTGKLTTEQFALHHWARNLGHDPRVLRSLAEFEAML